MTAPHICRHCGKPTEFIREHTTRDGARVAIRGCADCKLLFKVFNPNRGESCGDHPQAGA